MVFCPYLWFIGTLIVVVTKIGVLTVFLSLEMTQTLSSLLSILVDVFGKNSQTTIAVDASDIADIIDFL